MDFDDDDGGMGLVNLLLLFIVEEDFLYAMNGRIVNGAF